LDNNYRKAQQRKAADENIHKIFRSIESSYASQVEQKMQDLEQSLTDIKRKFQIPAEQSKEIVSLLKDSSRHLDLFSRKIIKEGGL
jgi:spore cortex formation protein SpoVR/YcgB (stage V sporulation)